MIRGIFCYRCIFDGMLTEVDIYVARRKPFKLALAIAGDNNTYHQQCDIINPEAQKRTILPPPAALCRHKIINFEARISQWTT